MTRTELVATFNVDQHSTIAHQKADLKARMGPSDTVCTQETVDIDLDVFAATVPGWAAFQDRDSDNDGSANTGVLYRLAGGQVSDTDVYFLGDTDDTRRRYLTAVKRAGVWYGSAHIFPARDTAAIPNQVARIGEWVAEHPGPVVLGIDRNQCPPGRLEQATGLKWHGVGIDGFLTNLRTANIAEFPKGFSDHPGVHADVTIPGRGTEPRRKTYIQQARELLVKSYNRSTRKGREKNAARAKAALEALAPKVKPDPDPPPETAPKPVSFPPVAAARRQAHEGPKGQAGMCLQMVRTCYGIAARYPDATTAWQKATVKHPETNPNKIPRGYPVFWVGGSSGHGHIAIATGAGHCWSTDIARTGYFDYVGIAAIHESWGLQLVGWTEDINGQPVQIHGKP